MSARPTMSDTELAAWTRAQKRGIQTVTANLPLDAYEAVKAYQLAIRYRDEETYSISETIEYLVWRGLHAAGPV